MLVGRHGARVQRAERQPDAGGRAARAPGTGGSGGAARPAPVADRAHSLGQQTLNLFTFTMNCHRRDVKNQLKMMYGVCGHGPIAGLPSRSAFA